MDMFIVQKKKHGLGRLIDSGLTAYEAAAAVGVGWCTPVVSAPGKLRQGCHESFHTP